MTANTEVAVLTAIGGYGALLALRLATLPEGLAQRGRVAFDRARRRDGSVRFRHLPWVRAALSASAAAVVLGIPVAVAAAAFVGWYLPQFQGLWGRSRAPIERGDAVAGWAEMLADSLDAGRSIDDAVVSTARRVGLALRPSTDALLARLESRRSLRRAVEGLDEDIDHPCGDLLVAFLSLAAARSAANLSPALRIVAARSRLLSEKLASVDAKRAGARKAVRIVLAVFVVVSAVVAGVLRPFADWYATGTGQMVLAAVLAAVLWSLLRLASLAELRAPERVRLAATTAGPPGEEQW